MKKDITITELDFVRLQNLINAERQSRTVEIRNLEVLGSELRRARRVDSRKITPEFVTMNSALELTDMDSGRLMKLKLVYPKDSNYREGKISVLSPLGSALLGYRVGDKVTFEAPGGLREIRIDKILYQPEANGEFTV
ncbi:MAG TPA: transcription elongation factor GreAB [Bacteroides sp.]|nr:transcription elongation factor GreAB [Bacteroides sp.]